MLFTNTNCIEHISFFLKMRQQFTLNSKNIHNIFIAFTSRKILPKHLSCFPGRWKFHFYQTLLYCSSFSMFLLFKIVTTFSRFKILNCFCHFTLFTNLLIKHMMLSVEILITFSLKQSHNYLNKLTQWQNFFCVVFTITSADWITSNSSRMR